MSFGPGRMQLHGGLLRGPVVAWASGGGVGPVLTGVAGLAGCAALSAAVLGWMPSLVWMVEDADA